MTGIENRTKKLTHGFEPSLFWEYDLEKFDWWEYRDIVVQRVIERGRPDDYEAMYKLYGGKEGVREIVKEVSELSLRDINFVCHYFNLEKEELKCYKSSQLRKARLGF